MEIVRSRMFHAGLMLATIISAAMVSTAGNAYTPEQQQACTPDAFRLCGSEIPDVERVTACMIRQRAQLSPECRVFMRPPEAERSVTPVTTRKPLKVRKPSKSKPV